MFYRQIVEGITEMNGPAVSTPHQLNHLQLLHETKELFHEQLGQIVLYLFQTILSTKIM